MYGIENLLAGHTLGGRYRIEQVIGRGGMGAVYRAVDQRLGREVAVKVVTVAASDAEAEQRLRARFDREARAAAQLRHPHVVSVHDFGTDAELELDFLVMELLRGEDLAARLARKGMPALRTALGILHQAARGLAAGHHAGLIHRDIKPGNLFLEPGERPGQFAVKVLDFGIAEIGRADDRTVTHLTVAGRSPLSPAYASPEQLRGGERLTPASDVFSLGATGFHLLTGRRPFTTSEPSQMAVELSASLAWLRGRESGLPEPVRALLLRALAHEPADRFPNAAALADALAPLAGDAELARADTREPLASTAARLAPDAGAAGASAPAEPAADATRLLADEPRPATDAAGFPHPGATRAEGRGPATAGAPLATHPAHAAALAPELQRLLEQRALQARSGGLQARLSSRPGRLRRAARATASFVLTTLALALYAAAWVAAVYGMETHDELLMHGGVAASVVLAPYTVYRVMGRRSSVRVGLLVALAVTIAGYSIFGPERHPRLLLAAVCAGQLGVALLVEAFTRGSHPAAAPSHAASRAVRLTSRP